MDEFVNEPEVSDDARPSAPPHRARAVSRRAAIVMGVVGLATTVVAAASWAQPASADGYPSWSDVASAKANLAAKGTEVARIKTLIGNLQSAVVTAQAIAKKRGDELFAAQQAFVTAAARADELQTQAAQQSARARVAAAKAGKIAAQLYENGGNNAELQLLLSGTATKVDDLLARLDVLQTVLGADNTIYQDAVSARDSAQSLTDEAKAQRTLRDRLQKVAQQKMAQAQAAATAAATAVANQQQHLVVLNAQLAALQSSTTKTIAQYETGVRIEQAREAAARRAAALAAERAAAQVAAENRASGGGGGYGGGGYGGSGWVRPAGGPQTSGYGWRILCIYGSCGPNFHPGVDLAPGCGAPIVAAHAGVVSYAGWNGGYGNYIRIDNSDGTGTGYGHIRDGGTIVSAGQSVSAGQVIAYVGDTGYSTGCHLHFETYVNGATVDPIPFMAARGVSV